MMKSRDKSMLMNEILTFIFVPFVLLNTVEGIAD